MDGCLRFYKVALLTTIRILDQFGYFVVVVAVVVVETNWYEVQYQEMALATKYQLRIYASPPTGMI